MADDEPFSLDQFTRQRGRVEPRVMLREQIDLVADLRSVARAIGEHCQLVMMGEPGRWAELAKLLEVAAHACRSQVIVDPDGEPEHRPST
jgi:hypothetical protein